MQKRDGDGIPRWRRDYIACLFSATGALAVYAFCALLIDRNYFPDITGAMAEAARLASVPAAFFRPEPKEKLLFAAALVVVPLAFAPLYLVIRKALSGFSEEAAGRLYDVGVASTIVAVVALGYFAFQADNPMHELPCHPHDADAGTNFQFYLLRTFLHDHFLLYAAVFFPLIAGALIFWERLEERLPDCLRKLPDLLFYAWCIGLILIIMPIDTFRFPYSDENKFNFSSVYYSVVQVYYGAPMLIDNFTNTYGLYPHFVLPVLRLTGLSIAAFSGLMAFLTSLCFLFLFLFLSNNLSSRAVLLFSFSSMIFYTHFYGEIISNHDTYFANHPIRLLFPALSLYLANLYLKRRTRRFMAGSFLILAAGVLWNPEYGVFAYSAFVLFVLYTEAGNPDRKTMLGNMFLCLGVALIAVAIDLGLYSLAIRVSYGSFPQIPEMFRTLRLFSSLGFNMLPMPLLHPWNLIALVYLTGIARSLSALLDGRPGDRDAVVFILTLLGIGSLLYYQGRSHNWNLLVTALYAFMLMAFFADSLLAPPRDGGRRMLLCLFIFVLGSSIFQMAYSGREIAALMTDRDNRVQNYQEQLRIERNADFIGRHAGEGERVLILTRNYLQALYHGLSHTGSAFNPGLQESFWRRDFERLAGFIAANRGTKVFYERSAPQLDLTPLVRAGIYAETASNGDIVLLERRRGL